MLNKQAHNACFALQTLLLFVAMMAAHMRVNVKQMAFQTLRVHVLQAYHALQIQHMILKQKHVHAALDLFVLAPLVVIVLHLLMSLLPHALLALALHLLAALIQVWIPMAIVFATLIMAAMHQV